MLKRAQCQAAREHQQTMASVVLGCRGCHQTGECGSGCQGAPTGWHTRCQAVRGRCSSPGEELVTPLGLQRQWAGTGREACSGSKPSKAPWPGVPPPAAGKPGAPAAAVPPPCPGPPAPVSGSREGPGEPPGTSGGRSTFTTLPTPASPWLPELRG